MMAAAKILIVEDDRVVARDISQQLQRIGHIVVGVTASGEQALRLTLETAPDLVLMDIRLEGAIDGIDAAEQIRQQFHLPIVFLTAYSDEETVKRATRTEPFGYLLKPFEDAQLRTVIEMALYKHAAERKLRESERRFAATLSSIGDAVIATDARTRITFMNPVAQTLTGWSQQEATGLPLPDVFRIVNEHTGQKVEDPAAKVLRLGTVIGLANHTVLLTRDGRDLPIDDCGAPIVDDAGGITGTVIIFRDMTERRQVEDALRKAQADLVRVSRLITMGQLTASIAHEVSQPISAVRTNATAGLNFLEQDPPDLAEAREALGRIVRDADRAGHVIRQIRNHIKKASPLTDRFEINDAVREVIALTQAEAVHTGVSVATDLANDLPPINGDRIQLQQVILNLVLNAVEAMGDIARESRKLRITTGNAENGLVLVTVEDTGPGLAPEARERLFEAFYTTKPRNLGMGLSICRLIVESHHGQLWASQNMPQGAIFQFTLPGRLSGPSAPPPPFPA